MSSRPPSRSSPGPPRLRGWRRVIFPAVAILLGLAPFVVLECALAVFDTGGGRRRDDPLAGFGRVQPLFELDEDGQTLHTARSRQLFFGEQQFARKKPDETFRIFCLGGSTVRGRPYETDTSFLKWLEIELNGRDSTRRCETVNCGGLSYASYRLARILYEVLRYEPDLIIIATGHNEFLEDRTYDSIKNGSPLANWVRERLYSLRTVTLARRLRGGADTAASDPSQLSPEVNARLDSQSGYASYHRDDQWRKDVIEQFEQSVRGMVDACRRARTPLILVNLGENLRDCPPFKSEHQRGLSVESLQDWRVFFDTAKKLEETSREDALKTYRKAESIDDQYALLIYRMARCFDGLREMDQARRYYIRAKDLDICPLRMLEEMHERLNRIASDANAPLVDARRLLVDLSPDGIPGDDCFVDHVHPAIGSHQRIAQALAARMEEMSLWASKSKWGRNERRVAYRRHFRQLGPAYLAKGQCRLTWLENWARRRLLDREALPEDARGRLRLGNKRLEFGESDGQYNYNLAWEQFQLAVKENPAMAQEILDLALELFTEGRSGLAEEILLRLHDEPAAAAQRPQTELALLVVALDAGRTSEAETLYGFCREVIEQAASSSTAWLDVSPEALEWMRTRVPSEPAEPEEGQRKAPWRP